MPSIQAGFAVIQRIACSRVTGIPAWLPAHIALAASWLSRWMPSSESEWMMTRAPACVIIAAFSGMPSSDSILKPHQSDQTEAETLSFASMSAIL